MWTVQRCESVPKGFVFGILGILGMVAMAFQHSSTQPQRAAEEEAARKAAEAASLGNWFGVQMGKMAFTTAATAAAAAVGGSVAAPVYAIYQLSGGIKAACGFAKKVDAAANAVLTVSLLLQINLCFLVFVAFCFVY